MTPARRATLWLLATCVVWGSTFFSMQLGVRGLSGAVSPAAAPAAFLFLRFLLATILFPVVFPRVFRHLTPGAAAGGLLLSLPFYAGFLLQTMGLGDTASTVSAFLTSLTVVLTPVFGRLFFREKLAGVTLAGAGVALAGVYVMTNPGGGGFGRGEALTLVSVVAFAVQIQLTNIVTRRHSPEAVTLVMFVCATLFSGAIAFGMGVTPGGLVKGWAGRHVAWTVVYTATLCSIGAIAVMNRFQRDLSPTRAAVLYTMEPIFAAVFATALVGDELTARQLAGGAIIVAGNLLCEAMGRKTGPGP